MDSSGLRRKDTTKGPPLRILSLDGGGVRGYSMLIILQELMHRTFVECHGRAPSRYEIPKPCDHFDLIAGSGTGGLIAIMLGRLRLDIETCKGVYVRMTKKVFETDKMIAGIPYRSTLFKASKLEEAIKECVRAHTQSEDEGNDILANATPMTPNVGAGAGPAGKIERSFSDASRYTNIGMSPVDPRSSVGSARWGNPEASLYDTRESRTKTAVTAYYKGTPKNGTAALLRSYDSRKEPAPEVNCTIWQAGRATAATALAFKPIQIGQSVFLDEGTGKYNPAPQILDEAVCNEWPGREVGCFVSIGTGKRPHTSSSAQKHDWWEGFGSSTMGDFAKARDRLIEKIEACEDTHRMMRDQHLERRSVNADNYYRLNVEVGVGDFRMNEWNRLSDISSSTRLYLSKRDVERMNMDAAAKLGRIYRAKRRHERTMSNEETANSRSSYADGLDEIHRYDAELPATPSMMHPMAVELPAADVDPSGYRPPESQRPQYQHKGSVADMKYSVISSDEYQQPMHSPAHSQQSFPYRPSTESYHQRSNGSLHDTNSPRSSTDYIPPLHPHGQRSSPPPLPPKTPLPYPEQQPHSPRTFTNMNMGSLRNALPYPESDGPPPPINLARKPDFNMR